ncbi:MAG: acyl-CoA dehydrogenase N-terminal domain-containing protein, partial [Deltaproteobacteria bacterium]|nr:acyl-CoA dehydrogenase N-terminal domain-containing protein [Deltaproteobacteria bacterium]
MVILKIKGRYIDPKRSDISTIVSIRNTPPLTINSFITDDLVAQFMADSVVIGSVENINELHISGKNIMAQQIADRKDVDFVLYEQLEADQILK